MRANSTAAPRRTPRVKSGVAEHPASQSHRVLWLAALILVVLAVYYPAWHGGVLWDDDGHVTRPELRSMHGLWRIWFDIGATQQYYPLVHSAFWLLSRIWGDNPLAYHVANIVLHASSAFLIVLILRRIGAPGAALAGVIFAVHPVQVESVAWMTELKNTLSGVLYLGSALAYLHFDQRRQTRLYAAAIGLFVLAVLSKTVTATLPAGLLVVFWWQRGRLDWRRDVVPLVPFFAVGAAAGLLTSWVEHSIIGAEGADFNLTLIERCLVAGRAIAFYLGKLVWPLPLIFMYPKWALDAGAWWQYLYPAGVAGALLALWGLRTRTRAPLAALLFFCLTLAPALGFVNVYPFKYSFVADHFQYLACIGVIVLFSGTLVSISRRWKSSATWAAEAALIVVIAAPLALLANGQSRQYVNAETLYRATLSRNPESWLAHSNLAVLELHGSAADLIDASNHLQAALRINPRETIVRNNLGTLYMQTGHLDQALEQLQEAVRLAPRSADAQGNLGALLQKLGRYEEAVAAYRRALEIKPDLRASRSGLAIALEKLGRRDEAAAEIREVLNTDPHTVDDHNALGDSLLQAGRTREAISEYQAAVRIDPNSAMTRNNLGFALLREGHIDEAARELQEAIRLQPNDAAAHDNLGNVLQRMQRLDEAVVEYRKAIAIGTTANLAEIHNDLGVALARLGRRSESIAEFEEAVRLKPAFAEARANLAKATARRP